MLALDVRSDASVKACLDAVLSQAGRLDVLIDNAGYALTGQEAIGSGSERCDSTFVRCGFSLAQCGYVSPPRASTSRL